MKNVFSKIIIQCLEKWWIPLLILIFSIFVTLVTHIFYKSHPFPPTIYLIIGLPGLVVLLSPIYIIYCILKKQWLKSIVNFIVFLISAIIVGIFIISMISFSTQS